jgi:GTP cyclohydrolase I
MVNEAAVAVAVEALLRACGLNADIPALRATPERVAKAWGELLSGYGQCAEDVAQTTDGEHFDGGGYDQAIVLRDVSFISICEHHLLPFRGTACVSYIPGDTGRVLGVSKLARLVDLHARRLQMQERLTRDVANDLLRVSGAKAVAVVVEAQHLCMVARGVRKETTTMVTSEMLGVYRDNATARAEVLALMGKR